MFRRYLKLFEQKRSLYISWNSLFLWGFGLWIALCISNMYRSEILEEEAALFYLQNSTFGIAYNISIKKDAIEDTLHITTINYALCNFILMLKTVLQYVHVFVSTCFVILFICSYEYIKTVVKLWNNELCNFFITASYFTTFARDHKYSIFNKKINKNDYAILESKLVTTSGINTQHLQTKLSYDGEEDELALKQNRNINTLNTTIYNVQNEIIFSSYTLLLFNKSELYQYFNNQLLKNHLLNKYFVDQDSKYVERALRTSNGYKRNHNPLSRKVIQRGIVSSSPEFQKFLANLEKSQYLYPCMLEVSTSYIIRIKSTYK